jgi:asparagine synthase (glutamine-hydrolysing)
MGFAVPLREWFRGELKDILYAKIESMDERFNREYLKKLFNEHQKGKNYEYVFWNLMRIK